MTSAGLYSAYKKWLGCFESPAIISREEKDLVNAEDAQRAFIRQAVQFG